MKILKRVILTAFLALSVMAPLWAQRVELLIDEGDKVKDPPATVNLEYTFKPGELRRYDVTVQGDGNVQLPGQKEKARILSQTTMTFVQHVKSYNPTEGIWKMEWDMIKGMLTIPEFGDTWLTVPPIDFEMDKYGAIRNIKGMDELTMSPGLPQSKVFGDILNQLRAVGFPHKPLHVGDKWEDKYVISIPDQDTITVTAVSELIGFERVSKTDCAKIHTTYETPFTLKVPPAKKAEEPAKEGTPSGQDPPATAAADEKPIVLKGKEKVESWAHFAYDEGRLIQSFGSIELSADIQSGDKATVTQAKTEDKPAKPETTIKIDEKGPAPDLLVEKPKNDLYVKFQMISKYNPDIPESMEELGK